MKKTLLTLSLIAALSACSNNDNSQKDQSKPSSEQAKNTKTLSTSDHSKIQSIKPNKSNPSTSSDMQGVSYIIGYDLGQNFNKSGINVEQSELMQGISAGMSGTKPKLSKIEMQETMQQFQTAMQAKALADQKQQEQKTEHLVLQEQNTLLNDPSTPYIGPKNAKVAVIEFFDYQCAFCSLVAPAIELSMHENPDVKFIFKDYPIFGQRWPESYYAADMGIVAFQQGGSELYKKYHDGIFATGHDEGKLTQNDIDQVANKIGINVKNIDSSELGDTFKTLPETVKASTQLGHQLGFQGTPAIIVMPTTNATPENTTIFFGYPASPQAGSKAAAKAINTAIKKASKSQLSDTANITSN